MRNYYIQKKINVLKLMFRAEDESHVIFGPVNFIRNDEWWNVNVCMRELFYEILEDLDIKKEKFVDIMNKKNQEPFKILSLANGKSYIQRNVYGDQWTFMISNEMIKELQTLCYEHLAREKEEDEMK